MSRHRSNSGVGFFYFYKPQSKMPVVFPRKSNFSQFCIYGYLRSLCLKIMTNLSVKLIKLYLFTCSFFLYWTVHAQSERPSVYPASLTPLKSNSDPAQYCVDDYLIDRKGRMWFKTCGVAQQLYALRLVQFDGYDLWPLSIARDDWTGYLRSCLEGESSKLGLYGFLNRGFGTSVLFTYDQGNNQIQYTSIQGFCGGIIEHTPGHFWVLTKEKENFVLNNWDGIQVVPFAKIPNSNFDNQLNRFIVKEDIPFIRMGDQLWFSDLDMPIFSYHLHTQEVQKFTANDFPDLYKGILSTFRQEASKMNIVEREGTLYTFQNTRNPDFYMRQKPSTSFSSLDIVPKGYSASGIYKDEKGQILFVYQNQHHEIDQGALLLDSLGRYWDYSPMLRSLPSIRKIGSNDFLKSAYVATQMGAFLLAVGGNQAIKTIKNGSFRHIRTNTRGEIITKYERKLITLNGNQPTFIPPNACTEYYSNRNGLVYLINDLQNNLWLKYKNKLARFEAKPDGSCETYNLGFSSGEAVFLSSTQLAIVEHTKSQLMIFDLTTRQAEFFEAEGKPVQFSGVVHFMILGRDEMLWVATNTGLFKIDVARHKMWHYGESFGFEDPRVLVVEECQNGLIWMGTASRGVHVFDPKQEKVVKIINRANGLSNNTVVNIVEDNDGDIWAGTYDGITLLSPEGEIISNINTEDGLSHYEFNRYAHYKDKDGKIYMGTVQGLNIIDPPLLKQQRRDAEVSQIYIATISYFDSESKQQVTLRNPDASLKKICLTADQRNLSLSLGMSNYGYAEKNRYAYQLEGISNEWIYIGNDHQIDLFTLPPGNYKLKITGIDKNGNWVKTPIELNIQAQEFFYKQTWFYLVLALPFIGFALLWIRRLRQEKEMLEYEVNKRTRQIQKSKALIEQQASDLVQLHELKSRFFANISHELRTPLTLITGPTELLAQEEYVKQNKPLLKTIRGVYKNTKKLLNLTEEMLDLASLEAQKIQLKETAVYLQSFCLQIFEAFQPKALHQQLDYRFDYQISPDFIFLVDQQRLERILNNLLSNAMKFTATDQSVYFRIYQKSDHLYFEIQDTGPGIPEEDLPHIFDRFFQGRQKSFTSENGTGIGLSLCKDLAHFMQGDLSVKSTLGQGSTFVLQLPARTSQKADLPKEHELLLSQAETHSQQFSTPQKNTTPPGRILVVEDNPEVRTFIEQILQSRYVTQSVEDGQQALNLLQHHNTPSFDLILSDIAMPHLDGYDLLNAVKVDPNLQGIPVIILTARHQQADRLKALRLGVDDYLTKPFSPLELIARIQNLLQNYRQREAFQQELLAINPDFGQEPSVDQRWLSELEAVALKALEQQLDLNSNFLADKMALSTRQLSRRVKALTGLTIGRYIQEVKLQKARFLIENKMKTTIAEVAYACGFKSPSYFSQLFAQAFGKLPSDYPLE